jgi:hypothetical protein
MSTSPNKPPLQSVSKRPIQDALGRLQAELERFDKNTSDPFAYIPPHVKAGRALYADWLRNSLGLSLSALQTMLAVQTIPIEAQGMVDRTVDAAVRDTEALALVNDYWEKKVGD